VNRIRAQLLGLESLSLLVKSGDEHGKRMFECVDPADPFWAFATGQYEAQLPAA
jgi:hypothetical protein